MLFLRNLFPRCGGLWMSCTLSTVCAFSRIHPTDDVASGVLDTRLKDHHDSPPCFGFQVKDETLTRGEFIALSTEVAEGQDAIRSCIANHTMSLTEIAQSLSDSQVRPPVRCVPCGFPAFYC